MKSGSVPEPIGFFPFHQYDPTHDLTVNNNKNLNHHLGMSMQVDFKLPSDKKNSSSAPGYAVIGREKQKLGSNNGGSGSGGSKSKPKGEKQIGKAFL